MIIQMKKTVELLLVLTIFISATTHNAYLKLIFAMVKKIVRMVRMKVMSMLVSPHHSNVHPDNGYAQVLQNGVSI
jgi:hypothetical protein